MTALTRPNSKLDVMAGAIVPESQEQRLTVVGNFRLDRETIRVWRGDKPLQLSLRQFRLLEVFMLHPGQALSREVIKDLVWGIGSKIEQNTVDAEIVKLRRAIGGPKREAPIRTIRSVGFAFQVAPDRSGSKRTAPLGTNRV